MPIILLVQQWWKTFILSIWSWVRVQAPFFYYLYMHLIYYVHYSRQQFIVPCNQKKVDQRLDLHHFKLQHQLLKLCYHFLHIELEQYYLDYCSFETSFLISRFNEILIITQILCPFLVLIITIAESRLIKTIFINMNYPSLQNTYYFL